jgi:predicted DNA-binding transcriptional regulator YafY
MAQKEMISRFSLIIKKLRKQPATFSEIADYLNFESGLQGYDFNISKRTFDRDRHDIRSLFNIDIAWDKHRKVYFLDMEDQPEANERILEAFDTFNALNITDRLSDYIHFENRKSMGTENLYGLLHVIKNRMQIKFQYQKFWEDKPTLKSVEPYALKEFRNRWYLVGTDTKINELRIYALDRLTDLAITKSKFVYPSDFSVNAYFENCFGIIAHDGQSPEEVVLSFTPHQGKYIKSLPLHHSQQILIDNKNEFRIRLHLVVTFDFVMEILSYGPEVKVIEPLTLKNEIQRKLQESLSHYK